MRGPKRTLSKIRIDIVGQGLGLGGPEQGIKRLNRCTYD